MANQSMKFEDIIKKLGIDDTTINCDIINNTENSTYKTIISYITTLPSKQFTLLSSLIGILLIDNIDTREQLILGKFINNIGQTIITAAAQEEINKKVK